MTKIPELKLPDWNKSYQILHFCPIETWRTFQSFGILFWDQQVLNNFFAFGKEMWSEKPIPIWKGNNPVETSKKKILKTKEAIVAMSGSILKYVMLSTLHRVYENCEECKLAHPKHGY